MTRNRKEDWYTRPVVFVTDVGKAINFYIDKLGFDKVWDYKDNEKIIVAQINRGNKCEIILAEDTNRSGLSRLFIELFPEELKHLKSNIKKNKIKSRTSSWGMPIIEIKDPFGNELFFPTGE